MTKNKIIKIVVLLIILILVLLFIILPQFFGRYWWINYSNYKQERFSFSEASFKIPSDWSLIEKDDNNVIFIDSEENKVALGFVYKEHSQFELNYIIKKVFGNKVEVEKEGKSKYLSGDVYWNQYFLKNSSVDNVYTFSFYLTDCNKVVDFITICDMDWKIVDKITKSLRT